MKVTFRQEHVFCVADIQGQDQAQPPAIVSLTGKVANASRYARIEVIAAAPADHRASFSGSALPHPNPMVAFEGTPNFATIPASADGNFALKFMFPNGYSSTDAFEKVPPSVFIVLYPPEALTPVPTADPVFVRLELPEPHPNRTLTHRPNRAQLGPEFYSKKDDLIGIRGSEATLRALSDVKLKHGLA